MHHYRFRSSFRVDVEILMSILPDAIYEIVPLHVKHPDVEVRMITRYKLDHIIRIMKTIPEGILMAETIMPEKNYINTFKPAETFSQN